jgi:hypothetical protein
MMESFTVALPPLLAYLGMKLLLQAVVPLHRISLA